MKAAGTRIPVEKRQLSTEDIEEKRCELRNSSVQEVLWKLAAEYSEENWGERQFLEKDVEVDVLEEKIHQDMDNEYTR